MHRIARWAAGALLLAVAAPAGAQHFDSVTTTAVAPGVTHRRMIDNTGPFIVNVLTVDLRTPGIRIGALRADDRYAGRERVTDMVKRHAGDRPPLVAAVNGDLFNLKTGDDENDIVIDGSIVKGVPFTDTHYDAFHNAHSQFGMTAGGRPVIDRLRFEGRLLGPAFDLSLRAVNAVPEGEPNALVLYDRWIGPRTPDDSAARDANPAELPLRVVQRRGDTVWLAGGRASGGPGTAVPAHGYVLAGYGTSGATVRALRGRTVRAVLAFSPNRGRLEMVVGGWGRLVEDGRLVADSVDAREGTPPSFSVTRHPRTGVGFSRDSSTLYLVTVDGRSESSSGMSLVEFARLFRELGAWQATNLDGGGSTTMVVGGRLVNRPSDAEGERAVGSAVVVRKRIGD